MQKWRTFFIKPNITNALTEIFAHARTHSYTHQINIRFAFTAYFPTNITWQLALPAFLLPLFSLFCFSLFSEVCINIFWALLFYRSSVNVCLSTFRHIHLSCSTCRRLKQHVWSILRVRHLNSLPRVRLLIQFVCLSVCRSLLVPSLFWT